MQLGCPTLRPHSPSSAFSISLECANLNSPSSLCSSAANLPNGGVSKRTISHIASTGSASSVLHEPHQCMESINSRTTALACTSKVNPINASPPTFLLSCILYIIQSSTGLLKLPNSSARLFENLAMSTVMIWSGFLRRSSRLPML